MENDAVETCVIVVCNVKTDHPIVQEFFAALEGERFTAHPVSNDTKVYTLATGEPMLLTEEQRHLCAEVASSDILAVLRRKAPILAAWYDELRSSGFTFQSGQFLAD